MVSLNTPIDNLLDQLAFIHQQREVMFAHLSETADSKTVAIVLDFMNSFDGCIAIFEQSVRETQRIVARYDKFSEAYGQLQSLKSLTEKSPKFADLELFRKELDALISAMLVTGKFISTHTI